MKTPCLKCGLIHDGATDICDGWAGIDPDETAGDTRKKAAERIRAVLAAVPIERRPGRARAAAAGAAASGTPSTDTLRPVSPRVEPEQPEVPEWRREVSERLESYRSRRERQSRERGTNQSVLAFRVHSKTETLEAPPEAALAAPAVLDAPSPDSIESSPSPADFSVAPAALDAAISASAAATPAPQSNPSQLRTYLPVEEADLADHPTDDLTADITDLASRVSGNGDSAHAALEAPAASSQAVETPAALPIAAEPAVVLADSTTLEVHADPPELAEVQTVAQPPLESSAAEPAPLAAIPSIDTEYWHSAPSPELDEEECGSLTSGFEAPPATHIEDEEEEIAAVGELAHEHSLPVEEPEPALAFESCLSAPAVEQSAPLPAEQEVPAMAACSDIAADDETPFSAALEATQEPDGDERQDEAGIRRAALRTAARPLPGSASDRIEIRVPQPVFDFSPNDVQIQQPQVEILPVADLRERRCAAFLDAAILAFTVAGFFLAFHFAGGQFAFSRAGAAVSIAAAFLIYSQYVLLFTVIGGATPGMVLRGLRVVCFDGKEPVTAELAWRSFGYLLSAAAGMLGFIWSAWDEHGLSWHDRISQTYITYADPAPLTAAATSH